jgi:hypothetical protein
MIRGYCRQEEPIMMFGGELMFGMALLIMLLVFGLPLLLVIAVLGGVPGFLQKQNRPADGAQKPVSAASNLVVQLGQAVVPARYCAHCGAGLQTDWTHCQQCGAPIP